MTVSMSRVAPYVAPGTSLFVVGGGGHGRVVLDNLLGVMGVAGILDPHLAEGTLIFGVPVVGDDRFLDSVDPGTVVLANGVGANGNVTLRSQVFERFTVRGFRFPVVQHVSAVVGAECRISHGAQVMAGAVLQNRVTLGENTVVNTRASLDHDCCVEPHAFIAPGVVLCGGVTIRAGAFIGAGAVVLPGLEVGARALVGAGAVVTRSVPEGVCVGGNPAARLEKH
jgi:sugar O-acyltransferase (sialic acid O-acetyltransferase NeuD family)